MLTAIAQFTLSAAVIAVAAVVLTTYADVIAARTRLVNHNLRLVLSVARKLEGRQLFEDLAQDGFPINAYHARIIEFMRPRLAERFPETAAIQT